MPVLFAWKSDLFSKIVDINNLQSIGTKIHSIFLRNFSPRKTCDKKNYYLLRHFGKKCLIQSKVAQTRNIFKQFSFELNMFFESKKIYLY